MKSAWMEFNFEPKKLVCISIMQGAGGKDYEFLNIGGGTPGTVA
jgi:hypothetical protein